MPITPNDVIINIHQYINNPFNGFEATIKKCPEDRKTHFIKMCNKIVIHGWEDRNSLDHLIEKDDEICDFFELLKDIYFRPLQTIIINRNDIHPADIPSIQLFIRMSLLKHISDILLQSDDLLEGRQRLVTEYERYPKSAIQFFNKKPIDVVNTALKQEDIKKQLRTLVSVTVWFLLLQLLLYSTHGCFSVNDPCKEQKNAVYIFNGMGFLGVTVLLLKDFLNFLKLTNIKNYYNSGVISPELDAVKDRLLSAIPARRLGDR